MFLKQVLGKAKKVTNIDNILVLNISFIDFSRNNLIIFSFSFFYQGFSLLSLFDRTFSVSGRFRLKEWMRNPICDVNRIIFRQNGVALVVRPQNSDFISMVSQLLKSTHDISNSILRIKKVSCTHTEWARLYTSIQAGLHITQQVSIFIDDEAKNFQDKIFLAHDFSCLPIDDLLCVYNALVSTIDIEATTNSLRSNDLQLAIGMVVVKEGRDQMLDKMRSVYDNLDEILVKAAKKTLQEIYTIDSLSVQYVPQLGYLVIVEEVNEPLLRCEDQYVFAYRQDGYSYFKSPITLELDENIGDIRCDISDRQKSILLELENLILTYEEGLHMLSYNLSCLDAIISLGTLAKELDFVRPSISEDSVIIIKKGRHILQEMVVESFVPNDTFVTTEKNIALITGNKCTTLITIHLIC